MFYIVFRIDVEIAAMTGGKASLEPAFFRLQFELSLTYGEVYVAGTGGNIDAVALIFAPGQDFVVEYVYPPSIVSHEELMH